MIIKRSIDLLFSVLGLILLFPVFIIIALWVKLDSPGPVFFRQVRVGKDGRLFRIMKFRTMIEHADAGGMQVTAGEDPRITRSGKILRKYKLDELPQLINVAYGDMSLVGPRPEVQQYVELFHEDYQDVLSVKPGMTDFAAIEFSEEEVILKKYSNPEEGYVEEVLPRKIELYRKYLHEQSLLVDLKIIFLTLRKIIKGSYKF